jgi:hypothetical protein
MTNENEKFTMTSMMAYESQRIRYAVSHSRGTGVSHATQNIREQVAAKPVPSYMTKADNRGRNNTGRVWSF